jgi:hypothetical protein
MDNPLCERCEEQLRQAGSDYCRECEDILAEQADDRRNGDGETFRGGEAAAYEREQMEKARRLK